MIQLRKNTNGEAGQGFPMTGGQPSSFEAPVCSQVAVCLIETWRKSNLAMHQAELRSRCLVQA